MRTLQQIMVDEHIGDLRRDAESLREERRIRQRTHDGDGPKIGDHSEPGAARVRVGQWLIGLGEAVSGSAGE